VTRLRQRLLEEFERSNYSQATAHAYVGAIRRFAEYLHRSPDQLGPENVRQCQLLSVAGARTAMQHRAATEAAIRFLFVNALKRNCRRDGVPLPTSHQSHCELFRNEMTDQISPLHPLARLAAVVHSRQFEAAFSPVSNPHARSTQMATSFEGFGPAGYRLMRQLVIGEALR